MLAIAFLHWAKPLCRRFFVKAVPYKAIKLLITQMQLEHRLSALLQLHLHSQLNTWIQYIAERQV